MPDPLDPLLDARCLHCGYSLAAHLETSARRCPECGRRFTLEELADAHPDVEGSPRSLSPHELIVPGHVLISAVLVTVVLGLVLARVLALVL